MAMRPPPTTATPKVSRVMRRSRLSKRWSMLSLKSVKRWLVLSLKSVKRWLRVFLLLGDDGELLLDAVELLLEGFDVVAQVAEAVVEVGEAAVELGGAPLEVGLVDVGGLFLCGGHVGRIAGRVGSCLRRNDGWDAGMTGVSRRGR